MPFTAEYYFTTILELEEGKRGAWKREGEMEKRETELPLPQPTNR